MYTLIYYTINNHGEPFITLYILSIINKYDVAAIGKHSLLYVMEPKQKHVYLQTLFAGYLIVT
jgi:hypothetical protein